MQRLIKCSSSRVRIKDSGLTQDVDDETSPSLEEIIIKRNALIKDVGANCFFASLLRTQIHMPRHTSSERAKY